MLRKASELQGYSLQATDGVFGKVHDFYFDDQRWTVRYLVADTGRWLSGRLVLIAPAALHAPVWTENTFPVQLTRAQIADSPGIETHLPVSRQYETELTRYYGWPMYWGGEPGFGVLPAPPVILPGTPLLPGEQDAPSRAQLERQPEEDEHLRSMREIIGYGIEATDGTIGHIHDFLLDDSDWSIVYLIADTRRWLPGKKVVISPRWIERTSWPERRVHVDRSRRAVQESPEVTGVLKED